MSNVAFREVVLANTTQVSYLELARPFIGAVTLSVFANAVMTDLVQVRVTGNGYSVLPIPTAGGSDFVCLDNHVPLAIEVNKTVVGPPYTLETTIKNDNAFPVSVTGVFELYNSPYPQTRVHIPYGSDSAIDPFAALVSEMRDNFVAQAPKK